MYFLFAAMFTSHLTGEGSVEKACNAMVTNPLYEGPLYEAIHPEFKSLTSLPASPMEPPRYLPIHQALPSEVAKALQDGTAIAVAGELLPGKNEDAYTVMSPVGTLSRSLQGGRGIPTSESFN